MKSFLIPFIIIITAVSSIAQRPAPDQLETSRGKVTIQPILHGSLVLTWNEITFYGDPYGGAKAFKGIAPPDFILITDIHGDHMNQTTLDSILVPDTKTTTGTQIIAPQAVYDKLPPNLQARFGFGIMINDYNKDTNTGSNTEAIIGSEHEGGSITISPIPMYNLPETTDSRHPKGRGTGYLLTVGGKKIYISGDTEDIPEMRALKDIDVAFVCMNLPFTMDINQAASAVLEFKPKVVYPYHYRGQGGLNDVEGFKKLVDAGNAKIEVRLRNWYPGN